MPTAIGSANVQNQGALNGQATGAEDLDRALLVDEVSGEIIASFNKATVMDGKYLLRQTNGAKGVRFEHVGGIGAYYHNAGEHIEGLNIAHEKSEITLDRPLVTSFFTDDFNEQMMHYDARKEYTRKMGEVLAQKYDRNVMMKFITAARLGNKIAGQPGGTVIINADLASAVLDTRVSAIAKSIIDAKKELIKKNVPVENIFCVLSPDDYFAIIEQRDLLAKQFSDVGSYSEGTVFKIGGVPLTYHNYIPQVNAQDVANTEFYDEYHGINCTGTVGFVGVKDALGVLRGNTVQTKIWDDNGRMGTWTRASIACGMGVLRPECSVELRSAALPAAWGTNISDNGRIGAGKLPASATA